MFKFVAESHNGDAIIRFGIKLVIGKSGFASAEYDEIRVEFPGGNVAQGGIILAVSILAAKQGAIAAPTEDRS